VGEPLSIGNLDHTKHLQAIDTVASVDGKPGQKVVLMVSYHAGRKHLPVIRLKQVA